MARLARSAFALAACWPIFPPPAPDADAAVGFYGVNIPDFLGEAANIKKPLMLHIAGKDGFVPPAAQAAMHAGAGWQQTMHPV